MSAAPNSTDQPAAAPGALVDRGLLDAARRRAKLPVPPESGWTACPAAATSLVVTARGLQPCDTAAAPLVASPATDWGAAWRDASFQRLRAELAAGRVGSGTCRTCAQWLLADLVEQAPLFRDDSDLLAKDGQTTPSRLTLRLPLAEPTAAVVAQVERLLPGLEHLVLDGEEPGRADATRAILAKLPATESRPRVTLRTRQLPAIDGLAAAMRARPGTRIEWLVADHRADFGAAHRLAKDVGAELVVRFVLTPERWYEFEDVALAAAAHGIPVELRALGAGGHTALPALAVDDLKFLKNVLGSAWARCGGEARPRSLANGAFDGLCAEVRAMLQTALHAGETKNGAPRPTLELPGFDSPWITDDNRRAWWLANLFGHADLPFVRTWIKHTATSSDGHRLVRKHAWFRALCHRLTAEQRPRELLELLRTLYSDSRSRADLVHADAAFLQAFDLRPYGGPWNERLGLCAERARKRPFAIGKARPQKAQATADITVLIPAYRHGAFIEEAIRSILAQRYADFRVLVVDDASPDDTVARARSIEDPRLEVRVNAENLGLGNSVLRALASIDTPFLALLNSDDLFHPDRLGICRDVLLQHPEVQLVTTGLALVDPKGGELTPDNASLVLDGQQVFDWVHWYARVTPAADLPRDRLFGALLENNFLATSSNLVCRTEWLREQAAPLRSLKYCLDWQLFLEAALANALYHIHEPLAAYRLHANNTVWFREGRRWSYYLEVNRVAAAAVQKFARTGAAHDDAATTRVLAAVAGHVAKNRETDGLALFLHAVLDALDLERLAESSPEAQALVQQLNTLAEFSTRAHDQFAERATHGGAQRNQLLGELAAEQLQIERGSRRWLQGYCDSLELRLRDSFGARDRLDQELAALHRERDGLEQRANDLAMQLAQLTHSEQSARERAGDLARDLDGVRGDLAQSRGAAAAIGDLLAAMTAEMAEVRAEHEQSSARARAALRAEQERAERLQAELAASQQAAAALTRQLAHESTQVRALSEAKQAIEHKRNDLVRELARTRDEMAKLVASREFRAGNFLWNKMPLAYLSRRGKKWYRRLLDAKSRCLMLFRGRRRANGVAVVAACWQWPIYSHTFVYQEMIGLTHMGLDVQMFHWDLGDTAQLHRAFGYLAEHRTQLQPIPEHQQRDKEYFEKTRPGRLRAFLERVAAATGKNVADLEQESLVLQGCTFARMAELAGARYLHSYFFYDQSFMAMQAAWLLDLPRGVSCYADHMLDDWPFKLVPLHVELATVVVATSARIKRELSAKSGGKYDDKIIVKPNGVDGARFPALVRGDRAPGEPFEVVSISRLEPKKGLTHLVEAIAALKQRGHMVKAHIVGSKDPHSKGSLEYAAAFERLIEDLGVGDRVILHGMKRQEELPPILQRCRAFVAPYVELGSGDKDGIPTAMLEALASGLPVVTTDSGSILEVVTDQVEGLVVPQRDSKAFAAALARLIEDPALERRLAKAARARFDREFDIRVTERRLHERVAAAIAKQKPR